VPVALFVVVALVLVVVVAVGLVALSSGRNTRSDEAASSGRRVEAPSRGALRVRLNQPARAVLDGWHHPDEGQTQSSTFTFTEVQAGTHTLDVWQPQGRRQSFSVNVAGGRRTEFSVTLQP
jgi:hypothetical protein